MAPAAFLTVLSLATGSGHPRRPRSQVSRVAAYIQEVAPRTPKPRAWDLGRNIVWASRHWGVDPLLLAAISRQESTFASGVRNCYVVARQRACVPTCDLGVTQVNLVWVRKWGLDVDRLVDDDAYALWVGARVLAVLRREYAGAEPNWFSRYNSANEEPRQRYEEALSPFLAVLEPFGGSGDYVQSLGTLP